MSFTISFANVYIELREMLYVVLCQFTALMLLYFQARFLFP
jgi:hypothetical protein